MLSVCGLDYLIPFTLSEISRLCKARHVAALGDKLTPGTASLGSPPAAPLPRTPSLTCLSAPGASYSEATDKSNKKNCFCEGKH